MQLGDQNLQKAINLVDDMMTTRRPSPSDSTHCQPCPIGLANCKPCQANNAEQAERMITQMIDNCQKQQNNDGLKEYGNYRPDSNIFRQVITGTNCFLVLQGNVREHDEPLYKLNIITKSTRYEYAV